MLLSRGKPGFVKSSGTPTADNLALTRSISLRKAIKHAVASSSIDGLWASSSKIPAQILVMGASLPMATSASYKFRSLAAEFIVIVGKYFLGIRVTLEDRLLSSSFRSYHFSMRWDIKN